MLKVCMLVTPEKLLTPAMIFLGIFSSMALDAGYVVLPPIAAALYKSIVRGFPRMPIWTEDDGSTCP